MKLKTLAIILEKVARLNLSIDKLKEGLPQEGAIFENAYDLAREYYSFSVLRDIECILECLTQIIGTLESKNFKDLKKFHLVKYIQETNINLWQRKIQEHFIKTILFRIRNEYSEYCLYALYYSMNELRNGVLEYERIIKIRPHNLEQQREDYKNEVIKKQNELGYTEEGIKEGSIEKPWFVSRFIKSDLPCEQGFLRPIDQLFEKAREQCETKHLFLLSIFGEYWRLSSHMHANLMFNTDALSDILEEIEPLYEHINNYWILIVTELLVLLFEINNIPIPKELEEISYNKELAENEYKALFFKEFTPWEYITLWGYITSFGHEENVSYKILAKKDEWRFWITYEVDIKWVPTEIHSFFLSKV